jgi:hypothetical protein
MRLAGIEKGGFYPYPCHMAEATASWFIPLPTGTRGRVLDPCAGEGEIADLLGKLLNLRETWESTTKEERKMLLCTMVQEVGCDVGTKRIVWVKVRSDYEILFRLMDGLDAGAERRYWIREQDAEVDIGDIGEDIGQIATGVKIAFPMPHNVLTIVEEYVQ